MKELIKKIDVRDVICLVGLSLLGTGLWWVKPWLSLVIIGSILIVFSIIPDVAALRQKRR